MIKEDFSTKECYELAQYALKYVERANELIDLGRTVLDTNDFPIKGKFVIDNSGVPGIGIKSKAKYQHVIGGPDEQVKEKDGKEVKTMKIRLNTTEKEIDSYFKSLRFVKSFESL